MSDSEDENFVFYGTPLEPIEEDEIVRKKPVSVADQIVLDENGKRRFHGAFTGGFSAGYFNTVGSKEGWAPSTFKSTRKDRSSVKAQNVQDFMDAEDTGAFGIAPQMLRPSEDYSAVNRQGRKRSKPMQSEGPIPGVPVLEKIIEPVKSTIGVRLLQKLGWRPGQGIGPRITKSDKRKARLRMEKMKKKEIEKQKSSSQLEKIEKINTEKTYGCVVPPELLKNRNDEDGNSSSDSYEEIDRDAVFAPDDYDAPFYHPKENSFGLGYKGLQRDALLSGHVDLFGPQLKLKVGSKKLNITGEAFGVGAFEDVDADIYSREDMSEYDFALETPQERKSRKLKESKDRANKRKMDGYHEDSVIEGFCLAKTVSVAPKYFPPPNLPANFEALHISRKSRFDNSKVDEEASKKRVWRHGLTITERQVLIDEHSALSNKNRQTSQAGIGIESDEKAVSSSLSFATASSNQSTISNQKSNNEQRTKFFTDSPVSVNATPNPSILERVERLKKFTQALQTYSSSKSGNETDLKGISFKPFMKNPDKQERYEKYLTLVAAGFQECLKDLQPIEMTDWEKEREKLEFQRAAALYKPISGVMSSRFVSAKSHDISHLVPEREILKEKDPTQDPIVAAKMNLFGKLTHKIVEWHPEKILSKRFNVPPPYPDSNIVGLRGDTSVNTTEPHQLTQTSHQIPLAKKSLFENLDFSKPPPGLFPAESSTDSTKSMKALEFSVEPNKSSTLEGKEAQLKHEVMEIENSTLEKDFGKPPLDLFKEIFADTSESEDEESDSSSQQPTSKALSFVSTKKSTNIIDTRDRDRAESIDTSEVSQMKRDDAEFVRKNSYRNRNSDASSDDKNKYDEKNHREKYKTDRRGRSPTSPIESEGKKGIFDNLDFSELNRKSKDGLHRERFENEQQDSYKSRSKIDENVQLLEKDETLIYGPIAPPKLSSSNSNTTLLQNKPSKQRASLNYSQDCRIDGRGNDSAEEDKGVWVEKDSVQSTRTSKKKRKKKSSKSDRNSLKRSVSRSGTKRSKEKHRSKSKHKSRKEKKDHKSRSERRTSKKEKNRDTSSGSSSDEKSGNMSTASSVEIHDSLDNKALLNKLKQITRYH